MADDQDSLSISNQLAQMDQLISRQYFYVHLEKFVGIDAIVDELLDAVDCSLAVSSIGYSEPLAGGVEDLTGGSTLSNELVDHQGDKELGQRGTP